MTIDSRTSTALVVLTVLASAGRVQAQEQVYPGVYIQETTHHDVEVPRSGRTPYLLGVEIPGQTVRGDRVQVILRPGRGEAVRVAGLLTRPAAGAPQGDVLVGKITPKAGSDPVPYDARRRAILVPIAPAQGGPDLQLEIVVPPALLRRIDGDDGPGPRHHHRPTTTAPSSPPGPTGPLDREVDAR